MSVVEQYNDMLVVTKVNLSIHEYLAVAFQRLYSVEEYDTINMGELLVLMTTDVVLVPFRKLLTYGVVPNLDKDTLVPIFAKGRLKEAIDYNHELKFIRSTAFQICLINSANRDYLKFYLKLLELTKCYAHYQAQLRVAELEPSSDNTFELSDKIIIAIQNNLLLEKDRTIELLREEIDTIGQVNRALLTQ